MHVCARSLLNKFDEFQSWIAAIKPDIVGITETWANKNVYDWELSLTGYDLFRKDRPVDNLLVQHVTTPTRKDNIGSSYYRRARYDY